MRPKQDSILPALLACIAGTAPAQPALPAEFDGGGDLLDRLFTVGGAASLQVSASTELVYDQGSMQIDIGFTAGGFFSFSTAGVGVLDAGAGFAVSPEADTFSITVLAPDPLPGGLTLEVTLRDDDNRDGAIDAGSDDDEWESLPIDVLPGLHIYNVPLSSFTDLNPGTGNDLPDYGTGVTGAMILTFATSASLPDGRIEQPVALLIDHAGAYVGEQTLAGACVADTNGDGELSSSDFFAWVVAFNSEGPACDQNADNVCTSSDFFAWIANFNAGC